MGMTMNTKVGANIRMIREQRGLSLRQLAVKAGRSASTISRIERGEESLSSVLRDIAAALNTTVYELEGGEYDHSPCERCEGKGMVVCPKCKGKRYIKASEVK